MKLIDTTRGLLSVKAARAACSKIANESLLGRLADPEAARFVASVLRWHPDAAQKFRSGLSGIEVVEVRPYRNRGFRVIRRDGTSTDISFYEATRPASDKSKLRQAQRLSVDPWMLAKKRAKYAVSPFDEVTGEPVPFLDSELDHYGLTFEEIAEAWASKQESIPLAGGDNDIGLKMLPEQEADWVAYHAVHATVRLVSSATHKRITAQGVRRGT